MACNMEKLAKFSKGTQELIALAVDHCSGDLVNFVSENVKTDDKSIDAQLRSKISDELLHGEELNYRTYRKYKYDIFEIIEVIMDQVIPETWKENPLFDMFVDERRVDLGDENEFYIEDNSYLTVSKFSGNHWDTNRERVDVGNYMSVPTSWYVVHFYDEFERFMKNISSFSRMMAKAQASFGRAFEQAVCVAFAGIGNAAPAALTGQGALNTDANKEALITIAEKVGAQNGRKPVFVGTPLALRKLQASVPDAWISDSAKEERKENGIVDGYDGYKLIPIPQRLVPNTYNFEMPNDKIYIITESENKPIKFVYEGDSRIKEVTDHRENMDMTLEAQIHTKAGVGIAFDYAFGCWTLP